MSAVKIGQKSFLPHFSSRSPFSSTAPSRHPTPSSQLFVFPTCWYNFLTLYLRFSLDILRQICVFMEFMLYFLAFEKFIFVIVLCLDGFWDIICIFEIMLTFEILYMILWSYVEIWDIMLILWNYVEIWDILLMLWIYVDFSIICCNLGYFVDFVKLCWNLGYFVDVVNLCWFLYNML